MNMVPNFFIIGAPKSGTTSMSRYLSEHPQVYFSTPKEPFFWCRDSGNRDHVNQINTLVKYENLFSAANPSKHLVVGEGSTTYLQSPFAVERIAAYNPNAKFLIMLRNPMEVVIGMHAELLRHGFESESDLRQAWNLQPLRARGECLPVMPAIAEQLQYRDVVRYTSHIKRCMQHFSTSSVHVMIFEDFASDTARAYAQICAFLGLPADTRTEYPAIHAAKSVRAAWINRFRTSPPKLFAPAIQTCTQWYYSNNGWLKRQIQRTLTRPQPRSETPTVLRELLASELKPEIEELSEWLGRDLSVCWN